MIRRALPAAALLLGACTAQEPIAAEPTRVLVYVQSAGYEHGVAKRAEQDGLSLVERQWQAWGGEDDRLAVTCWDPATPFTAERLERFDAVFFYTTGELPVPMESRQALLAWVDSGGAFTGAHCATDTYYEWAPWGDLIGAYFDGHPWHEEVRVTVEDGAHPSTTHLGDSFAITDEIYQFKSPYARDRLHVLLTLDTSSVSLDKPTVKRTDGDFAISWTREQGEGRVFYTAMGHRPDVWQDPRFRRHLIEGVLWAARR